MEYERLKENLQILDAHNHGQGTVINLTRGQKTESILLHEVISDCREILNKIEQGRMIESPCKVGDTVYAIGKKKVGQIRKCIVSDISIAYSSVEVHFNCDYSCDDCHFNGWAQDYSGEWTCYGEYGDGEIPFSEFGKTVFLSREEAEKKAKEKQA